MSEQAPSPQDNPDQERRKYTPLTDNCDTCNQDYELTPNNTELFYYPGQDDCTNMMCKCSHCGEKIRIFIGDDTFRHAVENGIDPIIKERNAPLDIYNRWCKLVGIELPKEYQITDRHEAIIHKFGESLEAIPDDIFWDNIEAETERPYNQKWID